MMGYIPQDYAFYPQLTLLENLEFFAGIQNLPKDRRKGRILECMEFCQISHMAKQKVHTFSGGLKRRTNIAIGLLADPDILLFDEPTVGIDPQSRAFILKQIKELQREGKTIVYTSHYMEEVEQLCDVLAVIDQGRILQQGSIEAIHSGLKPELIVEFDQNSKQSKLQRLSEIHQGRLDRFTFTCSSICSEEGVGQLMQEIAKQGLKVRSLSYGERRLEQVFLQMTDRELRD